MAVSHLLPFNLPPSKCDEVGDRFQAKKVRIHEFSIGIPSGPGTLFSAICCAARCSSSTISIFSTVAPSSANIMDDLHLLCQQHIKRFPTLYLLGSKYFWEWSRASCSPGCSNCRQSETVSPVSVISCLMLVATDLCLKDEKRGAVHLSLAVIHCC